MSQYILTIIDTVGVQGYIFATNNLRQNAGASFLADCAAGAWVKEVLDTVATGKHNILSLSSKEDKFDDRAIEKDNLQAELIYTGGGNAILLFDTLERAKRFTAELTRRVMIRAPGLQVAVNHTPFTWELKAIDSKNSQAIGGKNGVLDNALRQMKERKRSIPPTYSVLGLGVTSRCVFSGLPAVGYDKEQRPVSVVANAKEKQEFDLDKHGQIKVNTSHGRLINSLEFRGFVPARNFEKLGVSPDESSLIAIVHADGNSMGKRIEAIRNRHPTPADNRNYLNELRNFSASVKKASIVALQATVDLIIANLHFNEEKKIYYIPAEIGKDSLEGAIRLAYDDEINRHVLPFRPIVLGGDDTTFVCEGRLGLFLAHYYLQQFSAQTLADGQAAHCRAGVALVPLHFPFARAYEIAEQLCQSARKSIKKWQEKDPGVSAIDWHFAVGGMVRELGEVRRLEYTSNEGIYSDDRVGDLLMRPLRLDSTDKEWRSWPVFINTVRAFKGSETWRNRHNKVKALQEALRKGEKAVTQFRRVFSVDALPFLHTDYASMPNQGWQGIECGYFDAIEAMDRLIELDTTRTLAPATTAKESV